MLRKVKLRVEALGFDLTREPISMARHVNPGESPLSLSLSLSLSLFLSLPLCYCIAINGLRTFGNGVFTFTSRLQRDIRLANNHESAMEFKLQPTGRLIQKLNAQGVVERTVIVSSCNFVWTQISNIHRTDCSILCHSVSSVFITNVSLFSWINR